MKILGINALNHDAGICLIDTEHGKILFAAHSERYSGIKNDSNLNKEMFEDMEQYGTPDKVVYFENPYTKKLRQFMAGQYGEVFSRKNMPQYHIDSVLGKGRYTIDEYVDHHLSHASFTYFTSPYTESAVVCIDAIGEFDTISIWYAHGSKLEKRWSQTYPNSLGLWYSAMTQRLGLKPQEDEYILMGMAAWGKENKELQREIRDTFFKDGDDIRFKKNLHRGCLDWDSVVLPDDGSEQWKFDIAHNVQVVCEEEILKIFNKLPDLVPETTNVCYSGGVALNCVANSLVVQQYPSLWILPNPGDCGSSLGCAAYVGGVHLDFMENGAFLGYDIKGDYPIDEVLDELLKGNLVGVANGRAEYGPRALGNRSILMNPFDPQGKDWINNKVKHREPFRPFGASVLENKVSQYFYWNGASPYMLYVTDVLEPERFPTITHADGTCRINTVSPEQEDYYMLLQEYEKLTGVPILLNTSLNNGGRPIAGRVCDALELYYKTDLDALVYGDTSMIKIS